VSIGGPAGRLDQGGANMSRALWIVQGLLAALFLFAGGIKLVLPLDQLTGDIPLSGGFIRFIGVVEVLGAIGLILPSVLGIRPGLTPLAACGLVIIMLGAVWLTLSSGAVGTAAIPLVMGLLAVFVAYGRWRLAPLSGSSRSSALGASR
jgi:DoxX-like family